MTTLSVILALLAAPSIADVQGTVTVVRGGASHAAAKGEEIAKEDFLRIAESSSVTITLANGKSVVVKGKALLPGRRVHDAKLASGLAKLAVALQTVAGSQDGGSAPASMSDLAGGSDPSTRNAGLMSGATDDFGGGAPAPTPEKRGWWPVSKKKKKSVTPAPASTEAPKKEAAEKEELERSKLAIADRKPAAPRRDARGEKDASPLAAAGTLIAADDIAGALANLDTIVGDPTTAPAIAAQALVLRARLRLQSGAEVALVRADLARVRQLAKDGEPAHEAAFLLGALALSDGDRAGAKRHFDSIPTAHALKAHANALLSSP